MKWLFSVLFLCVMCYANFDNYERELQRELAEHEQNKPPSDGEHCQIIDRDYGCLIGKVKQEICSNYKKNKCIDKRRTWLYSKEKGDLIMVEQINEKCQKHGWSKYKPCNNQYTDSNYWIWTCYINGRQMEYSDCKGFKQ